MCATALVLYCADERGGLSRSDCEKFLQDCVQVRPETLPVCMCVWVEGKGVCMRVWKCVHLFMRVYVLLQCKS